MADGVFERLSQSESVTSRLLEEVSVLHNCGEYTGVVLPAAASTLNAKLKYQVKHLNESISSEKKKGVNSMTNVLKVVNGVLSRTIRGLYPEYNQLKNAIQHSGGGKFGDYKCMVAMPIAQMLKAQGNPRAPQDIAQEIISNLKYSDPFFDKCEVARPGFINVSLKPSYVSELVSQILVRGVQPPPISRKLRVIVDFSSPNIAKEMHVGHLRSTIIGDTICRLLEFVGHDVLRLNHVGDWGTQFGMLIAHLCDKFPDYKTVSPPISDLQQFYKKSKERFEDDTEFKSRAYSYVVRLQNGDSEVIEAWQRICDVSRRGFESIYNRLGVNLIERGESFYQSRMHDVVKYLESKGVVKTEEGRKVVFADGHTVPLTIQKSDGAFTYDTSDLAALYQRVQEEKGEWLIYVVDSGQSGHFQLVFSVGRSAGMCSKDVRIDHVGFGVVLGEDGKKFKSRSGDTVRLVDLLDEGLERARKRLSEKDRSSVLSSAELKTAEESVAYGCIKYADLSHTRTNDYVFSFDKMLEDKGNTAVYLLYTYTRIRSIARLANVSAQQLKDSAHSVPIDVGHEKELKLSKCIIRFPEVVDRILDDLCPHILCDYLYELCATFTEFYDVCYCVEKDRVTGQIQKVNISRLLLCEATAMILDKSFYILGLQPLAKM